MVRTHRTRSIGHTTVRKAAFLIVAFAASLAVGQVSSPANGVKEKVCTLATCLTDDVPKPAAEAVTVDFELMKSMHMAIQVKVNDAGPYRLIFDLGSPLTLISGRAAADGGLISQEKAKKKTFFGMRGDGKVKRLQVGELVAEDVPVMIMDHPTIEAAAEFLGPLDGIVGYPFFARYKFTIDYSTKKMTFTPGDYKPQNVMTQMFGRMFSGNQKKLAVPGGLFGLEVDKPDDDDQPGVVITRVYAGSPAADAGLLPTDRLMTLDGRWTDTVSDAVDAASFAKPGEPITISVRRGEQTVEIVVRPSVGL